MPLDKQKSATPAKPLTPVLSTAFRTSKTPLTPKLASSKKPSPAGPRRFARSETAPPSTTPKQDSPSPVTPRLNGNITPRSGARLSRTAAASPSTPGSAGIGNPSKTRPLSAVETSGPRRPDAASAGLRLAHLDKDLSILTITADATAEDARSGATEARLTAGNPQPAIPEPPTATSSHSSNGLSASPSDLEVATKSIDEAAFVYASDATRNMKFQGSSRTTPDLSWKQPEPGKLYRANDRATVTSSQVKKSKPLGIKPSSPAFSPTQTSSLAANGPHRTPPEPTSPVKAVSLQSSPAAFGSRTDTRRRSTASSSTPSSQASITSSEPPRRASVSSQTSLSRRSTQRKHSGVNSAPLTPPKSRETRSNPISAGSPSLAQPLSLPQSPKRRFSPRSSYSSSNAGPVTQTNNSVLSPYLHSTSPTKTPIPQTPCIPRTDESAANARRERKVLDLEISNSSLLAINRTLEREMRKQSTELRRFRRLSRGGRLSTTSNRFRSLSGESVLGENEYDDGMRTPLSDCEEEMSMLEFDDDDRDSSIPDDESSYIVSPTSPTDRDGRRCTRDKKRLMLDLNKHQQLLIDSQKTNLSIKRCLNWTEELINEGNKALAYQVKVSDMELGGKVLMGDQDEEETEDHDGSDDFRQLSQAES